MVLRPATIAVAYCRIHGVYGTIEKLENFWKTCCLSESCFLLKQHARFAKTGQCKEQVSLKISRLSTWRLKTSGQLFRLFLKPHHKVFSNEKKLGPETSQHLKMVVVLLLYYCTDLGTCWAEWVGFSPWKACVGAAEYLTTIAAFLSQDLRNRWIT